MNLNAKDGCPLHKFDPCKQLDCAWFTKLNGTNPNTGDSVDEYGCAVAWLPMLLIEGSAQGRSTASAVESFRNEMVESNKLSRDLLIASDRTLLSN